MKFFRNTEERLRSIFPEMRNKELRDDPSRIWNLIEKAIVSRPEKERPV